MPRLPGSSASRSAPAPRDAARATIIHAARPWAVASVDALDMTAMTDSDDDDGDLEADQWLSDDDFDELRRGGGGGGGGWRTAAAAAAAARRKAAASRQQQRRRRRRRAPPRLLSAAARGRRKAKTTAPPTDLRLCFPQPSRPTLEAGGGEALRIPTQPRRGSLMSRRGGNAPPVRGGGGGALRALGKLTGRSK